MCNMKDYNTSVSEQTPKKKRPLCGVWGNTLSLINYMQFFIIN